VEGLAARFDSYFEKVSAGIWRRCKLHSRWVSYLALAGTGTSFQAHYGRRNWIVAAIVSDLNPDPHWSRIQWAPGYGSGSRRGKLRPIKKKN
jgi:hypothetical protein